MLGWCLLVGSKGTQFTEGDNMNWRKVTTVGDEKTVWVNLDTVHTITEQVDGTYLTLPASRDHLLVTESAAEIMEGAS